MTNLTENERKLAATMSEFERGFISEYSGGVLVECENDANLFALQDIPGHLWHNGEVRRRRPGNAVDGRIAWLIQGGLRGATIESVSFRDWQVTLHSDPSLAYEMVFYFRGADKVRWFLSCFPRINQVSFESDWLLV